MILKNLSHPMGLSLTPLPDTLADMITLAKQNADADVMMR